MYTTCIYACKLEYSERFGPTGKQVPSTTNSRKIIAQLRTEYDSSAPIECRVHSVYRIKKKCDLVLANISFANRRFNSFSSMFNLLVFRINSI